MCLHKRRGKCGWLTASKKSFELNGKENLVANWFMRFRKSYEIRCLSSSEATENKTILIKSSRDVEFPHALNFHIVSWNTLDGTLTNSLTTSCCCQDGKLVEVVDGWVGVAFHFRSSFLKRTVHVVVVTISNGLLKFLLTTYQESCWKQSKLLDVSQIFLQMNVVWQMV